jgi:hypothetical protein
LKLFALSFFCVALRPLLLEKFMVGINSVMNAKEAFACHMEALQKQGKVDFLLTFI